MTKEEKISRLKDILAEINEDEDAVCYLTSEDNELIKSAIKALEQEPVLDKIRAEIKALSPKPTAYDVVDGNPIKETVWEILADVLQIIDKYKAESEDKK